MRSLVSTRRVYMLLFVVALLAFSVSAVGAQVTPMTQAEITTATTDIITEWGLVPFLMFFAVLSAAAFAYRKLKGASR